MSRLCEGDRIGVRTYTPNGLLREPEYFSNVAYAQSVTEYALGLASALLARGVLPGTVIRLVVDCSPRLPLIYTYRVGRVAGCPSVTRDKAFKPGVVS